MAKAETPPDASAEARRLVEAVILLHPGFDDRRGSEYQALLAYVAGLEAEVARLRDAPAGRFTLGDRVRKTKGSSWRGRVVGFYSATLTPIGYAVESEREPGSVQIYPEAALEAIGAAIALDPRPAGDIAAEIVAEHGHRGRTEGGRP